MRGGMVQIEDGLWIETDGNGVPQVVHAAVERTKRHHASRALLSRVEACGLAWLAWQGSWRPSTEEGVVCRVVGRHDTQPDHLATFVPDTGPSQRWLLLVDYITPDAGRPRGLVDAPTAVGWDRNEWESQSPEYDDGGAWMRRGNVWLHAGQRTPKGQPGVLVVERIDARTSIVQDVPRRTQTQAEVAHAT